MMKSNTLKTVFFVISCNLFLQLNGQTWNPNAPAYTVVYTDQQKAAQRTLATNALSQLAIAGSSYTFFPGVYRFSNGSRFINLYGRSNFTLIASGCTFIQENITGELFFVQNATNISIIGPLTIESDPLGYSQAKVTSVGTNSISFDVMSGYPTPKSPASGETDRIMVFDQNGVWKSPSPNSQWPFLTYSAFSGNNQSGTITTSYNGSDIVQVGDYIVIGQGEGLGTLRDVNGMKLQDITIHTGCTGLISWGIGTGDWHYTRVKAIPKPGTSQLIGGSGPQHSYGLGSNVYFDGCEFNGSTDDNLNVFSNDAAYFEMKNCKWMNSTVRVMAQGFRTVSVTNNTFTRIGQGLAITMDPYWNEGNPCYNATITGNTFTQTPYVTYWDYGAIHYGPVSGTARFTNVNITGNTISNGKGRGIYVNNTDGGTVANNIISGMTGAAVTLTSCTNISTTTCTPTIITPYMQINNGTWVQSGNATLAAGGTVSFGPQPGTGGSWSWTGVNGFTSTTRQITLTNIQTAQVGAYVATYTNVNGCISNYTFNVALTCTPTTITPYMQINNGAWVQSGNATLAAGSTVMFGPQPGTEGSWSWTGVNGFTATTRQITLTNIQTPQVGAYVATYTNVNGCISTYTFNVALTCTPTTITPYMQINNGAWVQSGNATLAAGGTVAFGPQPGTGGSWSWTGVNGFTATTRAITLTNIQAAQVGNYVATYTNDNGCVSNYTFNVALSSSKIKRNNTTIDQINNRVDIELCFFPNPASDFINVSNSKGANISIFDSLGKVVLKSNCADDLTRIDVSGLFNGFYMIQAQMGKEIVTQKLVITK